MKFMRPSLVAIFNDLFLQRRAWLLAPCIGCCANSRKCPIVLINRSEILQISFVNVFSGLDVYLRFSRVLHVI